MRALHHRASERTAAWLRFVILRRQSSRARAIGIGLIEEPEAIQPAGEVLEATAHGFERAECVVAILRLIVGGIYTRKRNGLA
jgi:hypothetical protein